MWILTGLVLGSIVTSTHADEESCRGRKAMLDKVKEIIQVECRAAANNSGVVFGGSASTSSVYVCGHNVACK